jgi:hypothetical protein
MVSPQPRRRSPWRWFWTIAAAALAGGLALPAGAYLAGKRLIGAYEGNRGVADYVGSIWLGAAAGEPQAWAVLLAPLGLVACWSAVVWGFRRLGSQSGGTAP